MQNVYDIFTIFAVGINYISYILNLQ